MEKTKIIYLRTENMVNYYINVENYQLYTRSSPNSKSAAGVQLVSLSGSIARIIRLFLGFSKILFPLDTIPKIVAILPESETSCTPAADLLLGEERVYN
ncbi:hypothetical protein ACI3PF_08485, partial [Lactococcus lactis]